VLSQPKIEELFHKFVTVRLHTDRVPAGVTQVPDAQGSAELRTEKFKNSALPYYVVVVPRGNTLEKVAVYDQGLIDSPEEFADFLNKALEAAKQAGARASRSSDRPGA
jgi:hypothetical protein